MADYNYAKTTWTDNQTPLSAANMNQIEDGIYNATKGLNDVTVACNGYTDRRIQEAITNVLKTPV